MTCFIVGVSSPSGGGKTAVVQRLAATTPHSVALYFDEYDDLAEGANIHPASLRQRILDGADYNVWQMPGLIRDLERLKRGQDIRSPSDGTAIAPQPLVFLDAALGRANAALCPYLDLMVYIDTPLDVAMARRIQRDYFGSYPIDVQATLQQINAMTLAYLEWARQAYLEMDRQVKPQCDLVLDGCLPVDVLARQILAEIEESCINNKRFLFFKNETIRDEELSRLIVGHVYKVAPPEANDGDDLRIIDESGEDYLYPAGYFEPLIVDANRHNKTISTHLPEWLYGILYAEAVAADKSVSALMREWLEERLDLPA